jgi:hypothetical protein
MKRDGITPLFPTQQWHYLAWKLPCSKDNHCCSLEGLCGKGAGSRPRTIRESKVLLPKGLPAAREQNQTGGGIGDRHMNGHSKTKENPTYVY